MIALLLMLAVLQDGGEVPTGEPHGSLGRGVPRAVRTVGEDRTFHPVPLARLADTKWTHVEVCGTVTLVKNEADGDLHVRLSEGAAFVVAESVPYHRLPAPKRGQRICVRGISRFDRAHGWPEVHPIEAWRVQ